MPSLSGGSIILQADFADIHNPGYGTQVLLQGSGEKSVITNWKDRRAWFEWMFNISEPGMYTVEALVKANEPCKLTVEINEASVEAEIPETGGEFSAISFGEIELSESGDLILEIRLADDAWEGIELADLSL